MTIESLYPILTWFLEQIIVGGVAATIAYGAFKAFASKWLDNRFSQKLENFRHENAKDIERLRLVVNGILSARVRLQDRELEFVGEIWESMAKALGDAHDLISPLQSYSDLSAMSDKLAREFLNSYQFLDAQKEEIISSQDRNKAFILAVYWWKRNKAFSAISNFNNLVVKSEIFLDDRVSALFKSICSKVNEAAIAFEESKASSDRKLGRQAWDILQKDCQPLIEETKKAIRERFGNINSLAVA